MKLGTGTERKKLGLTMSIALVVGNMIGSGIYLIPATLAPYGLMGIIAWVLTGLGALFLAMVFARLSRLMPAVGGPYAYTRTGFGDFAGFLVAWGYWISIWCSNAAIAVALVGYLAFFFPVLKTSTFMAAAVAIASIWFLTGINIMGIRNAGWMQLSTTILKLIPLLAIAFIGLFYIDLKHLQPVPSGGNFSLSTLTAAATVTLFAFLGLESATVPAENVNNPEKTIPRSTLLGTLLVAGVYIVSTFTIMGIVPPEILIKSSAPFADAAARVWGSWAGNIVAAGAAISCFGALNGWIMLQGQMPYAMARDKLFPTRFGVLSGRGTPVAGLTVSSFLVCLLLMMNYTRGLVEKFEFIILLATMTCLIPYVFSSLAEIMIVSKKGDYSPPSGKRMVRPLMVGIPAFIYSLWAIFGSGKESVYWGFLLLIAGIPVYVWLHFHHRTGS